MPQHRFVKFTNSVEQLCKKNLHYCSTKICVLYWRAFEMFVVKLMGASLHVYVQNGASTSV